MTYSGGWPYKKGTQTVSDRAAGKSAKMAISRRMELLKALPLFAGLSRQQLRDVARAASSHTWPEGSRMVVEGAKSASCFVIVEGMVEVVKGERIITKLGPGEFFGEIALLDLGPRTATVQTVTDVLAIQLPRNGFLEVVQEHPKILLRMAEDLARRIRETTEAL
jgi:CRP-like cAMP-binding protein